MREGFYQTIVTTVYNIVTFYIIYFFSGKAFFIAASLLSIHRGEIAMCCKKWQIFRQIFSISKFTLWWGFHIRKNLPTRILLFGRSCLHFSPFVKNICLHFDQLVRVPMNLKPNWREILSSRCNICNYMVTIAKISTA